MAQTAPPRKKERSCLALTIGAAVDGGIFGAAIGAIMASGAALQAGFTHGGLRLILRSGFATAISVGGFLGSYNGGICTLERFRKRRDAINPAIVGGIMGVVGAVSLAVFEWLRLSRSPNVGFALLLSPILVDAGARIRLSEPSGAVGVSQPTSARWGRCDERATVLLHVVSLKDG